MNFLTKQIKQKLNALAVSCIPCAAINCERGVGKTTALIDFAASQIILGGSSDTYAFVCLNECLRRNLQNQFIKIYPNIKAPHFLSFGQLLPLGHVGTTPFEKIFVDEIFNLTSEQLSAWRFITGKSGQILGVGTQMKTDIRVFNI